MAQEMEACPAVHLPFDQFRLVLTSSAPARAGNSATLCDLGVFMDQPAEPISPDDLDIGVNRVG